MRVLRTNKESVTAMLEAFVHDPLINWRLLTTADAAGGAAGGAAGAGGVVGADAGGMPRGDSETGGKGCVEGEGRGRRIIALRNSPESALSAVSWLPPDSGIMT